MTRRAAPARGGTLAACRRGQDRADTVRALRSRYAGGSPAIGQHGPSGSRRIFFGAGAERWVLRTRFSCVPSPSARTRTEQVRCYPICYPTVWDKRGLKQMENDKAPKNPRQIGTLSDQQGGLATAATELGIRCSNHAPRFHRTSLPPPTRAAGSPSAAASRPPICSEARRSGSMSRCA